MILRRVAWTNLFARGGRRGGTAIVQRWAKHSDIVRVWIPAFAGMTECGAGSARAEARGSDRVAWANEMPLPNHDSSSGGMGKLVCPWLAPSFPPGKVGRIIDPASFLRIS
jgi:hypothetical protein